MSATSLLVFVNNFVAFSKNFISFLMLKVKSCKSGSLSVGSPTYEILKPFALLVICHHMRSCLQTKKSRNHLKKWIINRISLANNKAMESAKKLSISNNAKSKIFR